MAGLLLPEEESPIRAALVDEDKTQETILFSGLLGKKQPRIISYRNHMNNARKCCETNGAKPNQFLFYISERIYGKDLYEGQSVTVPIIGNPSRPTDSFLVKELVESMMRYISVAQSTILTVNEYAKKTDMPKEERQELMYQQFMDFTLYTLGKDKLLDEEIITNVATSSPTHYYILSGWFITMSVWLFAIYTILGKEEHSSMLIRMKLFGVTTWQRILARILISLRYSLVVAAVVFFIIGEFVGFELFFIDYFRFGLFTILNALLFLVGIALIDVWISSRKVILLLQSFYTSSY